MPGEFYYTDASFSTATARMALLSPTPKPVLYLLLEPFAAGEDEMLAPVTRGTGLLDVRLTWPRLADGGVEAVSRWLHEHPDAGAVAIRCLDDLVTPTKDGLLNPVDLAAFVGLVEVARASDTPLLWLRRWPEEPARERLRAQKDQILNAIREIDPNVSDGHPNTDRKGVN